MKKIFALVLSLCMVLSTFVAVSAQEQVWNEGTPFVETTVSAGNDFESGVGAMFVGEASLTTGSVAVDGRNALKVDYAGNNAYSTVIGFEFKDTAGNKIDLYGDGAGVSEDAVINWSIDVKMEDITSAAPVLVLRDGANPPSGQSVNLKSLKTEANGEWVTYSGSKKIGELSWAGTDATYTNLTVRFYPSAAGTMYIDNMSATITEKSYYDELGAEDKSLASSGLEYGPQVTSVSYADGYADATLTGTGNNSMVGTWLRNTDGTKYVPQAGDKVDWSVDINPSADFALSGGTARGVIIRTGGAGSSTSLTPSGNYQRLTTSGTAPANTWTSLSGTYIIPSTGFDVSGWTGICIRTEFTGSIKVKNLNYSIRRDATTVVETGWGTPDYTEGISVSNASNSITTSGNSFIANMSTISAMNQEAVNDTTCWIRVTPSTPLSLDDNWTFTFDITASGLVDTDNVTSTKLRLFDNATGTTMANTLGWVTTSAVPTTDGTYRVTLSSDNYSQAGSGSGDIVSFCICYNFAQMYGATTGSATFSNFNLVSNDSKVALSAEKTANGVDLTLANNNAEDYKFSGRLLVAEYEDVDGVQLLIQFKEVEIAEEIAAGDDTVVSAEFLRNITSGNEVKVFVWEPGSMEPIQAVEVL